VKEEVLTTTETAVAVATVETTETAVAVATVVEIEIDTNSF
jgi:hypothetical protein